MTTNVPVERFREQERAHLRPLHDGPWSSTALRTNELVSVVATLMAWSDWAPARQHAWAQAVVIRTVREILPPILRASDLSAEANHCARVTTLKAAQAAAKAARAARSTAWAADAAAPDAEPAAEAVARAAEAAETAAAKARAAEAAMRAGAPAAEAAQVEAWAIDTSERAAEAAAWAAWAARAARASTPSADEVLRTACRIWREAARDSASLAYAWERYPWWSDDPSEGATVMYAMHRLTHASQPEPRG
jgi:hypothetical protein